MKKKKNYFPYAVVAVLSLMAHTAVCMEDEPTRSPEKMTKPLTEAGEKQKQDLTKQLEALRAERKQEQKRNGELYLAQQKSQGGAVYGDSNEPLYDISSVYTSSPSGSYNALDESYEKLSKLSKQIEGLEKILSSLE